MKLYAIIDQPPVMYSCQVNQTFETHDKVAAITFDNANGTLSNVLPGMTVLVGSTPGAWDKGMTRVRKPWASNTAYIGEVSDIAWTDNLYLTVLAEFCIWPRHLRVAKDLTIWMDYDITYTNQHNVFGPVPVLGPDRTAKLTGESIALTLNASQSWVFDSTITQYAWGIVNGMGTLTDANTATPTLIVTTPGRILLRCTVTAANGAQSTGYRTVHVYSDDAPPVEIELDEFTGSVERGGFDFAFALPVALVTAPRDNCKILLVGEENNQAQTLAVGWLDESACTVNAPAGKAVFTARGSHYWLNRITGYPSGARFVSGTPARWTEIKNMTVDRMLWHLAYWRSTLTLCTDFRVSGDTRLAAELQAPTGTLWEQMRTLASETILAWPVCDALGGVIVRIPPNLRPMAQRVTGGVIITKDDYQSLDVTIRTGGDISRIELSGIVFDGQTGSAVFSLAPGHIFARYGRAEQHDRLLLSSQGQANELAGLILARERRQFDVSIDFLDIRYYGLDDPIIISVSENDTPAKVTISSRAWCTVIEHRHNVKAGKIETRIEAEIETLPAPSINGDIPVVNNTGENQPPSIPAVTLPPLPPLPPIPGTVNVGDKYALCLTESGLFFTESFNSSFPRWRPLNQNFKVPADYQFAYDGLVVNKFGRYYVRTGKKIWGGVVGYPPTLLADVRFFQNYFDRENYQIFAMGLHPSLPDRLVVLAGESYPVSYSRYFVGGMSGLTVTSLTLDYSTGPNGAGSISFGKNNTIVATFGYRIFYTGKIQVLDAGLTTILSENDYVESNWAAEPRYHARNWSINKFITYGSIGQKSIVVTNDSSQNLLSYKFIAAGIDPTGNKMMAWGRDASNVYALWKSINSGTTWQAVIGYPGSGESPFICPMRRGFVSAGGRFYGFDQPSIYATTDMGLTWQNKTGNLHDFRGNTNMSFFSIRTFDI